ncbi:hypothetical protein QEZ54_34085 [Catellatospora sp. KI3]|uniref:hypothetical protein n=1 Tax=Catellatospora sp. KI3 TaxID=3041620 RepID=UPI002482369C|nr:hypothetical protein [Catellatospora sp. KI3]MDI1466018.1 hypothetical protein [Catellatospora sp. KI3]
MTVDADGVGRGPAAAEAVGAGEGTVCRVGAVAGAEEGTGSGLAVGAAGGWSGPSCGRPGRLPAAPKKPATTTPSVVVRSTPPVAAAMENNRRRRPVRSTNTGRLRPVRLLMLLLDLAVAS